jgi:ribonuclease P protein component
MCAAIPTLKASPDFRRIAQSGQKWVTPAFILQLRKKNSDDPAGPDGFHLGLTVSRKVGNAVKRNRAKRRLREMVRLFLQDQAAAAVVNGYEIVLIGRVNAIDRDFTQMQKDFRWALKSLKVLS